LFEARNKENIVIKGYGAEWLMHKKDYQGPLYERAEGRHSLTLRGCRNISVSGLRILSSGGDGFYIGRGLIRYGGQIACENIDIRDINLEDHHRQGISVISAKNLLIENCTLQKTRGTKPQFGIDFEPNNSDELLENYYAKLCD
jgi:polygalacturonase